MSKVAGRVAFITGAARGQGRSHAVRFAEEGASIIALDLCQQIPSVGYPMANLDDLQHTVKLVEEAGGRIVARQADVRDKAQVQAVLDEGVAELGRLDFVLANAGIMPVVGPEAQALQAWDDGIAVLLTGVYHTIAAAVPRLLEQGEGGCIVITGSTASLVGNASGITEGVNNPGYIAYHAAKHGVVGLMRLYANMLASGSIRVNAVHPNGVNSPMVVNQQFGDWVAANPSMVANMQNPLPVQLIEPVEISNAILYLCSEDARSITGVSLPVDAGFTNRV